MLYHIKHPLLALERVASVSRSRLILWTQVDLADLDRPAMAYYPGKELNDDPTNWWGPNPLAIEGMLKTVGFSRVEMIYSRFPPQCGEVASVTRQRGLPRLALTAWTLESEEVKRLVPVD